MKPQDLQYPFRSGSYYPTFSQGVLFIPKRLPDHYLQDFSAHFKTDSKVFIEFCSGNGEWIVQKALESPNIFWIAVELKFDRVQKIWAKMHNLGLKNLLIIHGEAQITARYYIPENIASQFFINFPDPWPKSFHAKYRLITGEFLEILSCVGKKDATLTFVTDDQDYLDLTRVELQKSPYWGNIVTHPFSEEYGDSYFYRLWKSKDKMISRLQTHNLGKKMVHPIRLDLSLESDLKWEKERELARSLLAQGGKLEIYLDFGLILALSDLSQLMKFNTYLLSVEAFSNSFYPEFAEQIESVVFFKGPLDFIAVFYQKDDGFAAFRNWLKETFEEIEKLGDYLEESLSSFDSLSFEDFSTKALGRQLLRLFAVSAFSEYLHRLASKLPEDVIPTLRFDRKGISKEIFYEQLISQEVFPHFHIRKEVEARVGVVIPAFERCSLSFVKKIEKYLGEVKEPIKFIPERYLSENWLGIDHMILSSKSLSSLGVRQLKGFEAAGGETVDLD